MDPIERADDNFTYKGPANDIADLGGRLNEDGSFTSHWVPSQEEIEELVDAIQNGDFAVELTIYSKPIPPISVRLVSN